MIAIQHGIVSFGFTHSVHLERIQHKYSVVHLQNAINITLARLTHGI